MSGCCADRNPRHFNRAGDARLFQVLGLIFALGAIGQSATAGVCPVPGGNNIEECGFIVGVGPFACPGFRADDGTLYRLLDTGSFETGDRVFVRGTVSPIAATCLATSTLLPLMECNTIEKCIAECGLLTDAASPGCMRFTAADGTVYALVNPGPFVSGQSVFVTGFLGATPTQCGPDLLPTLDNDSIDECVSAFGRILEVNGCSYFQSVDGGRFDLDVFAGFEPGDFVFVEGGFKPGCSGTCGFPCLQLNTVDDAFAGTGVITNTADCGLVFEAENTGQRRTRYVLDDFGGFQAGDRVFVAGRFQRDNCPCTVTDILRRDGCISVDTIGTVFADCGFIQPGPGTCFEFVPDSGGGPYPVEFTRVGHFNPATGKAFVVGTLDAPSPTCGAQPTIRHNFADPCMEGCGVFGQGIECNPLLSAGTQLQLGLGVDILWVENRTGLPQVDALNPAIAYVKGGLSPDPSVVICGYPSLRGNLISPCSGSDADIDGNGVVNAGDIDLFVNLLLLVQFLPTAPDFAERANFNGDYRLDGNDLQLFVEAFLDQ